MCRCNSYFLFCIPAQKLGSVGFVAEIDCDGVALRNDLFAIDQVGQGDSGVFLNKLWFDLIEPFGSTFNSRVFCLSVCNGEVLKELSQTLGEAAHVPVSERDCGLLH